MQKTALTEIIERLEKANHTDDRIKDYSNGMQAGLKLAKQLAIEMLPKERKQIIDGIQLGYDYYGARYATNKKKIFDITFTQYKP